MPERKGKSIRPEMTVRQVAADFPASKEVFRRHGEVDSPPARFGHLEPLTHFANRRGIPLHDLLSELAAATSVPIAKYGRHADRIHRGFVAAALLMTLSLGAGWGAWLLWQIGMQGDFSAAPAAQVIAHGEAQLWGFILLFVMGISLRTVLQNAARHPLGIWNCRGLLTLTLAGIGGGMLWSVFPQALSGAGIASAAVLCLMSFSFWSVQMTVLSAKWPATSSRFILVSGIWLCTWAATTLALRVGASQAGPGAYSNDQRLLLIELAVFGFAMNSIYGFGQILLPGLLRTGKVRNTAVETAFWIHNAGAVVLCLASGLGVGGSSAILGSGLLAIAAGLFAVGHRGFIGRRRTSRRDEQGHAPLDFYPPLAFFWLLAALALMTGGVIYEAVTKGPLPHAYMGAVRHALTVGFMTTLILGVGQRLIPVLDRTVLAIPGWTIPILALIGMGNALRVGSELATMLTPAAFSVMPFSAFFEWLALLLFTITTTATMFCSDPLLRRGQVTNRSSLAVLLAEHPWIEDHLRTGGSGYLQRTRSVPEELTIGSFAESEGYDATEFVSRINEWLRGKRPRP